MIVTKKVTQPAEMREVTDYIQCDLCGAVSPHPDKWGKHWTSELATTVEMKTGYSCPDGGDAVYLAFDICPPCWKSKLMPWMESQGAKVRKTEFSY